MIYRGGDTGAEVARIQKRLEIEEDGHFGSFTLAAVIAFQQAHGLNADGVVGALTWTALFGAPPALWVPDGPLLQKELFARFGDPHESSFKTTYLKLIRGGAILFGGFAFWGHYLMQAPILAALDNLAAAGAAHDLTSFAGCFNVRNQKGASTLSTHAWGLALDFNATENPLGGACPMSRQVVRAFAAAGFEWGGLWHRQDCMHFQLAWTRAWPKQPGPFTPQVPRWEG